MKRLFLIFCVVVFVSCKREEPVRVDQLQVYNSVLDELVRNRFYYRYLSEEKVDSLWRYYNHNIRDKSYSIEFHKYIDKITQEVESDTAKQKSILLYAKSNSDFKVLAKYNLSGSSENLHRVEIRNCLLTLSSEIKSIFDSLKSPQKQFIANDFHSGAFKISDSKNEIGRVCFSKLFFNDDNTEAALYYEFTCDQDCGFGEILILQNKAGKWVIKEMHQLWIS